jgi:NAD+-dependent protein deacetylase sirtuin 6
MRDFRVRNAKLTTKHKTGRTCDNTMCGGDLKDTIINFDESLNKNISAEGFRHGNMADLMLCLGSSMRVSPANLMASLPPIYGGDLVICNL